MNTKDATIIGAMMGRSNMGHGLPDAEDLKVFKHGHLTPTVREVIEHTCMSFSENVEDMETGEMVDTLDYFVAEAEGWQKQMLGMEYAEFKRIWPDAAAHWEAV